MFNIQHSIQLLRDAEWIATTAIITDADRQTYLACLRDAIVENFPGLPAHSKITHTTLARMHDAHGDRTPNRTSGPQAQKQGRKAKGVKDQTEVVAGRTEASAQEDGQTTGSEGPAQDAGSPDRTESLTAAT